MTYSIWKWLHNANLPARGAGIIVALIYLAIGAVITLITAWIWPGLPQWKYGDTIPVWEYTMIALVVIWFVLLIYILGFAAKRFSDRYQSELKFEPGKKDSTDDGSTEWD